MSGSTKKKADLKVVLIGSASVGKTSLVVRYIEDSFHQDLENTIGASFFLKQWGPYNVAVWDTAGEERFSGLSNFYCRDAGAAVMTYDITSRTSFEELRTRFLQLLPEENCLRVVVGAKLDLVTDDTVRAVTKQEGRQFATELNQDFLSKGDPVRLPFFETSSKTGELVSDVFEYIFEHCLSPISHEYRLRAKSSTIDIRETKTGGEQKQPANSKSPKKCC